MELKVEDVKQIAQRMRDGEQEQDVMAHHAAIVYMKREEDGFNDDDHEYPFEDGLTVLVDHPQQDVWTVVEEEAEPTNADRALGILACPESHGTEIERGTLYGMLAIVDALKELSDGQWARYEARLEDESRERWRQGYRTRDGRKWDDLARDEARAEGDESR
jgi:hypothetical protein